MNLKIINATNADLPVIFQLFEDAMLFQRQNNYIGWMSYDPKFIRADIANGLLYKMVTETTIVCIFSICYNDELIWRQKERGDSIYIHRVVINQHFKGKKLFQRVLNWVIETAIDRKLKFVRIDTWAENTKLINYYKDHGFSFIENFTTSNAHELPLQHRNLKVALLELSVKEKGNKQLKKVNLPEELSAINEYWDQKIIGEANGQLIKLAKGIGEINWHKHDDQDELFLLHKGHLTIQLRDQNVSLHPNDMFIVPKGVEHCPIAHIHSEFLIIGINITSNAAGGRPDHFNS